MQSLTNANIQINQILLLNTLVSLVKYSEDGRVLPWHFPMTEPKSSLTDLRRKGSRMGDKRKK